MLVDHEHRYAFLRVPKTASTSVVRALGHEPSPADHGLNEIDQVEDYLRFCFVREPLQRFVSAYRYSVSMVRSGLENGHWAREVIRDHSLDADIDRFVAHVANRGDRTMLLRSLHFRPQIWWIRGGRPHYIGRFESIDRDFERLVTLLGGPGVRLEHANRSEDIPGYTLGSEARRVVSGWYRDDFRFLGYPTPL